MLNLLFPKAKERIEQANEVLQKTPQVKDLLPRIKQLRGTNLFELNNGLVKVGCQDSTFLEIAQELIPWRKGPFQINDELIDSEWKSDLKWQRIVNHIDLNNKVILDIGCNNAYYMFQMLNQNPRFVLGIDPIARVYLQYKLIQQLAKRQNIEMLNLGVDDLNVFPNSFDTIFSMGILYHHRSPLHQLMDIRTALKPGGELILETIVIQGPENYCLTPTETYARMKNVWFVPTKSCLFSWLERTKFINLEEISLVKLRPEEQRSTKYCPSENFKTLVDSLDSDNHDITLEAYPAPYRIVVKASRK